MMANEKSCGTCHYFKPVELGFNRHFGWCGWLDDYSAGQNEPEGISVYDTYGDICPVWQIKGESQ